MFLDTAAAARAANQPDRAKVAKTRASDLEPKLSRLTIRVGGPSSGLEVKRDGQLVAAASYDMPVPVDPGSHRIDVTAPGKTPYSTSVDVGTSANVAVQVPPLVDAPVASGPAATEPSAAAAGEPAAAVTPVSGPPADRQPSKALPYALLGVGVVGVAVGTVFELKSRGKNSDALEICKGDSACLQSDIDRHDTLVRDAKSDNLIALVAGGVGVASAVTGLILLLRSPSPESASLPRPSTQFAFGVGPQGATVVAKGSF
jgi:hypothetical protein